MTKARMPRDDNSQPIPVLRYKTGGCQRVAIDSTSTRTSIGGRVITLVCTVDSQFETGKESVEALATSHFAPANFPIDIAIGSDLSDRDDYHTHIAIRCDSTGFAYISERE
jgi:hypothetical protein